MGLNLLFGFGALLIGYTAFLFALFAYILDLKLDKKLAPINKKLDNHITDTNKKIEKLSNHITDTNKKIEKLEAGQAEILRILKKNN